MPQRAYTEVKRKWEGRPKPTFQIPTGVQGKNDASVPWHMQVELKDSKGKFGRVLGTVVVDGIDVNNQMVMNHLAVRYTGQSKKHIQIQHQKNRESLIQLGIYKPVDNE